VKGDLPGKVARLSAVGIDAIVGDAQSVEAMHGAIQSIA
jgi:hypothetical protein